MQEVWLDLLREWGWFLPQKPLSLPQFFPESDPGCLGFLLRTLPFIYGDGILPGLGKTH
jgi:hypothetical protein